MSRRFSVTSMTSELAMLKAATMMIRIRMTNMTRFSVCIQEKRFAFSSIQSLAR